VRQPVPLILDVDTGTDDALALAYAIQSPHIDLIAVTTVAGNVSVEKTTANSLAVLDWLGADSVPVHRGASRPLVRPHRDAIYFHDEGGLGGARLPASRRPVGADRGPAAIIRLALQRPREMTLVMLGPLTNLAIALNVEPGLVDVLKEVVVMGGAYRVPGNTTPAAEFNILVDAEAAEQVFAAPFRDLTVVGLDVTQQVALTPR
jgi:inosine-uridine nucleoside N-ribohydrolase